MLGLQEVSSGPASGMAGTPSVSGRPELDWEVLETERRPLLWTLRVKVGLQRRLGRGESRGCGL